MTTRHKPHLASFPSFLPSAVLGWVLLLLTSCSMTKDIPAGDQLFVGLDKIVYENYEPGDHFTATKTEVEAALATAPNGSLFGSSYYRIPFSWGVTVWNKYADKDSGFARWMTKTFGKQPVLMSWVNPELRASVAQSVLRNNGYFGGRVSYQNVPRKNPKTAKIRYTVSPGRLYTIDTVGYYGFPAEADSIIRSTLPTAFIHQGDAFSAASLDAERNRVSGLLRNQGYYYYQPAYASFLADTFQVDGKAQLRFQLADDVPEAAKHKWYIGRIAINMKKQMMEQPTDSLRGRFFTIRYSGKKPPIRPRVLMADLKLRPRQPYSYANYVATASKINAMGLFSMTDFNFTPRDTTALCDTLDLTLNCVFDKPWDFYIETVFNARTIGRLGPELRLGVTRRNAFRGGEKIDISLHGSYEWTTSGSSSMSSYEYGADASVEFPRLIAPFYGGNRIYRTKDGRPRRRIFYGTPTTLAKFSVNILHRPKYYRMTVFSGEWTYRWQKSVRSRHELSPLTVKYQYMNHHTDDFEQVMLANPYLRSTMQDYFIPEMRYTYTFTSAPGRLHPIRWETTVAQSGNLTSLAMMAFGKKWSERDKKLFSNPYSQFLKLETDFSKTWTLGSHSRLVGHVNAGIVWAFGNSRWLPNSESFYVGGANSIRAFSVREIGPGSFAGLADKATSYLVQNGDLKFVCNLEYRRRLFGSLHAAVFLDAGNVWNLREPDATETTDVSGVTVYGGKFQLKNMLREMAVGTGIGLRYDLDFLILRLDWGIALHAPYDTGRSGFYNIPKFSKGHALHFAIGYPF